MSGPTETRIMLWVLAQLQERYPDGLWERQNVIRAQAGERFVKAGTTGQADIRGLYLPKNAKYAIYVEFEIKKVSGKQTPAQIKRQALIHKAGGIYCVVHNPAEAFMILNSLENTCLK